MGFVAPRQMLSTAMLTTTVESNIEVVQKIDRFFGSVTRKIPKIIIGN